jgi:hypothetical protein
VIVPAVFSTFDSAGRRLGRLFGRGGGEPAFAGAVASPAAGAGAAGAPAPAQGFGAQPRNQAPRQPSHRPTGAPPLPGGEETREPAEDGRADDAYFDEEYELPSVPNGSPSSESGREGREDRGLLGRLRRSRL